MKEIGINIKGLFVLSVILLATSASADVGLLMEDDKRVAVFRHDNGQVYYRVCTQRLPLSGVDRNCPTPFQEPGHATAYRQFVTKLYSLYGVPNRFNYYPGALDEVSARLEELSRSEQTTALERDEATRTETELKLIQNAFDRMRRVEKEVLDHLDHDPVSEGFDLHRHKTGHRIIAALGPSALYFEGEKVVWRYVPGLHAPRPKCNWPWTIEQPVHSRIRLNAILKGLNAPSNTDPIRELCYMEVPE